MKQQRKPDMLTIAIYGVIGIALLYVCAGLGACMDLNVDENGKVDYSVVMSDFEKVLTDHETILRCIKAKGFALKVTVFGMFAELIYVLMKATSKKKLHRKGEEHGSARWANDKEKRSLADKPKSSDKKKALEMKEKVTKDKPKDYYYYLPDRNIILTNDVKMSLDTRQTRKNLNVCVIGGSGSGKSRFYVKPNAMQANTSYVMTDPKGELLRATGKFLSEQGYEIKVFNLIDMAHSNNYNPFDYIYDVSGNYSETAVIKMINVLMQNTKKEGSSGGDQFWDDSTELLLSALCFYLIEVEDKSKRNFSEVMKLLKMAEVKEGEEDFKSDLDLIFDSLAHPENYAENSEDRKRLDGLGVADTFGNEKSPEDYMCLKYYSDFKKAAGDTLKSIIISVAVRLKAFNLPKVMDLTCCDTLELNLIGDRPTALYIVIPSSDNTFNFLAAMMYTQMFDVLYDRANFVHGGRLPWHVRCLLDEFANIGQIPRFEELLATMRSMEISANIILQNLSQLKKMYKDSWENVIGNCDSLLFLGGQEPTTLEHVSKMLGKETIDTISHSRSKGKSSSSSTNDGILGRELMTVDELKVMKDSDCILFVRGIAPFFCKKFNIEKHVNYKRLEDSNKEFAYGMENVITKTAEKLSAADEKELTTESVSENDDPDTKVKEIVNKVMNQENDKLPSDGYFDIPTAVIEDVIGENFHSGTPLSTGDDSTIFNSIKAKIADEDKPFSARSDLDDSSDMDFE